ncbi:MAG: DUF2344 domain-containing protein, partial [Clostridia bacterium]|nr:DUF2344 domain-containing protein [Clostridia bacterium]
MRAIFRFGKIGRLRFVSHLDLQRYMQRALNRTNLPAAYSLGFNPHPVMSFASALAMGWQSEYEVLDIKLSETMSAKEALKELRSALPEELPVYECRLVDDNHASMMSLVQMSDYRITPDQHFEALKAAAREFLFSENVMAIRKTKSSEREINIRPLCVNLTCDETSFKARLMLTEKDTLKPDLLMNTLMK